MIGLSVKDAQAMFFDRAAVESAMDQATKRALSKFGAFVRTRARSSIRKRKKISEPGMPPSSHVGHLKKFLFFVYEPARQGVVIGPAKLGQSDDPPAGQVLEHGFAGSRRVVRNRKRNKNVVKQNYRKRPFMGPAFDKELPGLPALWRDAVTR